MCCRKEVKRGYWPRIWQRRSLCSFHAFSKRGGRCGSHYHSFLTASTKDWKCLGVHKNTSFLRAQLYTSRDFFVRHKRNFSGCFIIAFQNQRSQTSPHPVFITFFFFFALICIFYSIQMCLECRRPNKTTNQI